MSMKGITARQREDMMAVLAAALKAVDPAQAVRNCVRREGTRLVVGDNAYDLDSFKRILVVGAGKASGPMAQALEEILESRLEGGVVNVKEGYAVDTRRIELIEAAHPVPDESGLRGTDRILRLAAEANADDLVFCLISGGGSALMELPAGEITLDDLQQLTDLLLRSGATINEVNTVRKHISQVKGGGLARAAAPATLIALILSDVVGNPLDFIASGPTVPDTTTFQDAWNLLGKFNLQDAIPQSVRAQLERGLNQSIPETPKEGDPIFARTASVLVGSNEIAARAALDAAQKLGYNALLVTTWVEGEAREVAKVMAGVAKGLIRHHSPLLPPACLIFGGETTVTVGGEGKGGRSQEMALAVSLALDGWENVAVMAVGTDGTDGPTDAAGGIADGTVAARARALNLDPLAYLDSNDSYHFLRQTDALLVTGPTNTNVNDLIFVYAFS
ncbi:MAG: glycerate kinase [Chloroflexi bacterium]|nr:glycerate kinase [Chloroflexota bacterium]